MRAAGRWLLRIAGVVYCLWMLWLLFGQRLGTQIYEQQLADGINLVPFATVGKYIQLLTACGDEALARHAAINLAGNVVLFIPLGIFLPSFCKNFRSFLKTALAALGIIVAVEMLQYVTLLGSCDVDDLILNMIGVLIGYPIWRMIRAGFDCQ